ncbi:NAD(P)/FAD-dependent oxidoreductase [Pedobacter frigoris]|uniref:NAD(P)/FAD-dependent oxidoreductase n=1 Tax=Pedobacter frigoris TaxID=2571272 RepID=A0A4U1CNV2_9SPHI|nr:NAD(P)/FAD-dependent oxidoreductase [Pedobacter frigoris]TKC09143.1 NAD(P)/FAD-dependent oxidoreductase [Pedobacter frigoris]
MNPENTNIIIIGGGLAGLTCAIHLLRSGLQVMLIEKNTFPQHKVCGEYISNEVLPYLRSLDIDPFALHPEQISRLVFSSPEGETISSDLPLGGFGISRFALDNFIYEKALELGCVVIKDTVEQVSFSEDEFAITTHLSGTFKAKFVIGAYGKRANIDQKLQRDYILRKSPWLAVKAHYSGSFPDGLVAVHNFKGGYCGVSKVEDNRINICYLADYKSFKVFKNIDEFQKEVMFKNPQLKQIFESCTLVFEQPLTISQISFDKKEPVYDHILMIGDTAGLIHPLCGNGMAMAIHSAKICAELLIEYTKGRIASRVGLEKRYARQWDRTFKNRLLTGRILAAVLRRHLLFKPLLNLLVKFPSALPFIIKLTHGKPFQ